MRRYLLDTCVLIWLLNENERIKELAEDINYFQGDYAISVESIKEFIYLIQSGKINTDITFDELINALNKKQISIYGYDKYTLKKLSELPFFKNHPDPSDRVIIAQAIADKRILITGDLKFENYPELRLVRV
ncbi:MAG: PIN domain-containing protein [Bacteroidales bacterium]|nr:PIN domain-containing protein [Bacteroidales bacterium]